jgi:uncharacterized Zn-binding protein involved in type VI secretion
MLFVVYMPPFLLHVGATAICPHAGQISIISSNTRVMLAGQPAATLADTYTIAGCPFTVPPGKPQPCVTVRWLVPAMRVMINGNPAILQNSVGLCQSAEQIPQGPPNVIVTQVRVKGM